MWCTHVTILGSIVVNPLKKEHVDLQSRWDDVFLVVGSKVMSKVKSKVKRACCFYVFSFSALTFVIFVECRTEQECKNDM